MNIAEFKKRDNPSSMRGYPKYKTMEVQ